MITHRTSSRDGSFQLHTDLPESALDILLEHGLADRAPDQVKAMKAERQEVDQKFREEVQQQKDKANNDLQTKNPELVSALSTEMARAVVKRFRYVYRMPYTAT